MVTYEVMYFMKRKNKGKQGWMILKLDMSKAYGLVKLGILESVLQKMDFEEKVDHLFMTCIFSVNYQINHAGGSLGTSTLLVYFDKETPCPPIYF